MLICYNYFLLITKNLIKMFIKLIIYYYINSMSVPNLYLYDTARWISNNWAITQFLAWWILSYPTQLCKSSLTFLCPADKGYPVHLQKLGRVKNRAHTSHFISVELLRRRVDGGSKLKTIGCYKKTIMFPYIEVRWCEVMGHLLRQDMFLSPFSNSSLHE